MEAIFDLDSMITLKILNDGKKIGKLASKIAKADRSISKDGVIVLEDEEFITVYVLDLKDEFDDINYLREVIIETIGDSYTVTSEVEFSLKEYIKTEDEEVW